MKKVSGDMNWWFWFTTFSCYWSVIMFKVHRPWILIHVPRYPSSYNCNALCQIVVVDFNRLNPVKLLYRTCQLASKSYRCLRII